MNEKIFGKTYSIALKNIIEQMRNRVPHHKKKHILFVPDKYTLYAEQMLYQGTAGAFDAEVLTFNRLFLKLCGARGNYLSKQGAVMVMRKVSSRLAPTLSCFSSAANMSGFAQKMYDTIAQLKSCRIFPQDLKYDESSAHGLKMKDICAVYQEYLLETEGKRVDAAGRFECLIEALQTTEYFKDTTAYFANFDAFTAQTKRIKDLIEEKCEHSYEAVSTHQASFGKAEVYEADDLVGQLKAVAKRIRDHAFGGMRYDEMGVVASGDVFQPIKRIFTEFEIPFFIDHKLVLSEHPLGVYLKLCLVAGARKARKQFIALSKNPYANIDKKDADLFENYCNKYCIDYLSFGTPFEKGEEEERNRCEQVRQKLNTVVEEALQSYKAVCDGRSFYDCITKMLKSCKATVVTASLNSLTYDLGDVPAKILKTAEVMMDIFDGVAPPALLQQSFFDGLASTEISLLPALSNVVTIGEPSVFRGHSLSHLFVLNFADGEFPYYTSDSGMITDSDIALLQKSGAKIEPSVMELNERALVEAEELLCCGKKLTLLYNCSHAPSLLLNQIKRQAESVFFNAPQLEHVKLLKLNDYDHIAKFVSCKENAAQMLAAAYSGEGVQVSGFESELKQVLGNDYSFLLQKNEFCLSKIKAEDLFFTSKSTSISKVQEYFMCPYAHFLKYGLALKIREDGEMTPLDIGNFLHKVIELYVRAQQFDDAARDVPLIVDQIIASEEKYRYGANEGVIKQIKKEAVQISSIVASQIMGGSFKSLGQEMLFDEGGQQLKTITFTEKNKTLSLKGVIDRADVYEGYARVVDYKTGKAAFNFTDLYYGTKVQLMLYMKIMRENGFRAGGMFYFPFSVRFSDNEYSHRLKGVFNSDPLIAKAMDKALIEVGVKSEIIAASTNSKPDKEGNPVLSKRESSAYDEQTLNALSDYALEVLKNGVREILEGNIFPSPCVRESVCACQFCDYRTVCGYDYTTEKTRVLASKDALSVLRALKNDDAEGAQHELDT